MTIPGGANALLLASTAESGYKIERSLRFNDDDSASLSRTPSSEGNRKTWTWSGWLKRCQDTSLNQNFWSIREDGNNMHYIRFDTTGVLRAELRVSASQKYLLVTNAVFRDFGAWYHLVLVYDSTQSTASNRVKLYVNGTQITSFSQETYPSQSQDGLMNKTVAHYISDRGNGINYFDGYMAEIHFVDGQALAPTDFGEYDDDNNWNPKEFTGTYDQSVGGRTIANSTGAVPILNTSDADGQTVSSGVRSDSNSANIVLALPLNGSNGGTTITDYHHTIKGSGSAKAVSIYTGSASGGAVTSTAVSKYYGSSFYVVRGATNNYTASDYIYRTGDSDLDLGTGSFCVEFWYYPTAFQSNCVIFDNRHESNSWPTSANGFSIVTTGNGSIFTYSGGNQIINHSTKLTLNAWNHIAYTRDGSTERLFVNGDFFSTTASSSRNYNEGRFHLGSAANNGEGSDGYYQDLRIYKGVAKYTSNFNVPALGVGGVNSFYLKFDDNASNAALGTDSSGLSNTWTVNNLSVASGAGNDSLIDTPTNYAASGNNGGNYATFNPLSIRANQGTMENGNLKISATSNHYIEGRSTIAASSFDNYSELTISSVSSNPSMGFAVGDKDTWIITGGGSYLVYRESGAIIRYPGNTSVATVASYTQGDVLGMAVDNTNVKFYKNGSLQGTYAHQLTGEYFVTAMTINGNVSGQYTTLDVNFGQRPFAISSVPTGYKSLCTQNLPNPTIADGSTAMDIVTYTGNSASSRAITGLNLSPDLLWIKSRSTTQWHFLADTIRGNTKNLASNATDAEETRTNRLLSFDSNGFSIGNNNTVNENNSNFVAWAWDAGSLNTSISAGSLNSSVYNQSQTWSNNLASDNGYYFGTHTPDKAFNGDLSNKCTSSTGTGGTLTLNLSNNNLTGTLEVVTNTGMSVAVTHSGGTTTIAAATSPDQPETINFGSLTSISQIVVTGVSAPSNAMLYGIKLNGKILADSSASVPNVPSIASTVRANTTTGFSIVSWSGTSANATVGHGLNAAPKFIITKVHGMTSNWYCYHTGLTDATKYIWLNSTNAEGTQTAAWNSTDPTSSVIHVGGEAEVNRNGYNTIAYCFAPVEGFSAFGSYIGNGSATDPPFVYTGFRPRWVLFKNASGSFAWHLYDTARDTFNLCDARLRPDNTAAEDADNQIDILSNGFMPRTSGNGSNQSGSTFIYAAFAEHPLKTARAR